MRILKKITSLIFIGMFIFTVSASATVGNQYSIASSSSLPYTLRSNDKYIKFWINCEQGVPISVYIADEYGNIISGGEKKTISKGQSTTFYFTRQNNYTGYYKAYISTQNGEYSMGWYNYTGYESLRDASDEAIYWGNTDSKNATPSNYNFYINNVQVGIAAYQIDGNNYVKLRDIAYILNCTDKQFNVTWNNNIIYLSTNTSYITVGGELDKISNVVQLATKSKSSIYKDGHIIYYNGYLINGNNFYKLRDIAQSFNFEVSWDTGKIFINTTNQYSNNS